MTHIRHDVGADLVVRTLCGQKGGTVSLHHVRTQEEHVRSLPMCPSCLELGVYPLMTIYRCPRCNFQVYRAEDGLVHNSFDDNLHTCYYMKG